MYVSVKTTQTSYYRGSFDYVGVNGNKEVYVSQYFNLKIIYHYNQSILFNKSLNGSILPDDWEIGHMTICMYKKGEKIKQI